MKIQLSHPDFAVELVNALNETDCLAARTAADTIEVFVPWLRDSVDTSHAAAEIRFFVRAWALGHPGLRATVLGEG